MPCSAQQQGKSPILSENYRSNKIDFSSINLEEKQFQNFLDVIEVQKLGT